MTGTWLLPLIAVIGVIALALLRARQTTLLVNRLWIVPTAMLAMLLLGRGHVPPGLPDAMALALAALAGAALGAWRAARTITGVDVAEAEIHVAGDKIVLVVFAVLMLVKTLGARLLPSGAALLAEAGLVLSTASVVVLKLQCYRAYRSAARAPGLAAQGVVP